MISLPKNFRAAVGLLLLAFAVMFAAAPDQQAPPSPTVAASVVPPIISSVTVSTNGQVHLRAAGEPGSPFLIQISTNLVSWTALTTNVFPLDGQDVFLDFSTGAAEVSFYRLLQLPEPIRQPETAGQSVVTNATTTRGIGKLVDGTPPTIVTQPQSVVVLPGSAATFTVTATGTAPLSYQWRFNGTDLVGQTGSSLFLPSVQSSSVGDYTVIVSNPYGSVTSLPANLAFSVIWAWGRSDSGQLAVQPWMTNNIVAVAAGEEYSLALRNDGTVKAWGANTYGQTNVPAGLSNVVTISAGFEHNLALKNDGTVVAWGDNSYGKATVPSGLVNVIGVSAGRNYSLALKSDGTVVAWGANFYGETDVPRRLSGVVAVSAGVADSLALKNDGTLVGWGDDQFGEVSIAATLSGVSAIDASGGTYFCLALKTNGTVVAWGINSDGETNVPPGLSNVIAINGHSGVHSLALKADGTVTAWGWNVYGQTNVPASLNNVIGIAAGGYHSLALLTNNANLLPYITITSPTNKSAFTTPANIPITATASDWDGTVARVDFYAGDQLIGMDTTSPYSITWTNPPAGTYTLTAKSTDNRGGTRTSTPITVSVSTGISPVADAHVKEASPTSNYGTATLLEALSASGDHRVAFFRFDLSNVPVITGAKLRINAAMSGNATVGTTAYSVSNTNWSETGITWNNRPSLGTALGSATVSGTTFTWYELDVGSYVKSEKLAGRNIISLALTNAATSTRYIQINSREAASNKPQLLLSNTNTPPTVSIVTPTNNAVFLAPANVTISATASDTDGTVTKVEFFAGAASVGVSTSAPYSVTWQNAAAGTYTLTSVATDNNGATKTSAPVVIVVNSPPSVSLTSPANNSQYLEPASVALSASATDSDGSVAKVEFYQGTNKIAEATSTPYNAIWSNVSAGSYSLTAKAIDNQGAARVSSAANITVYPLASGSGAAVRLGFWRFETTNWLGEMGQIPKFFTNILNVADGTNNHVLEVDNASPANLKYKDVEDNHAPNIDVQNGTIVFRFKPNWSGANAGGTGPGALGQLISVGQWTSNASYGCWNLSISADGTQVFFISQTNGIATTNLVASVSFSSNTWYQIALTCTPSNSAFYINAQPVVTNGTGVAYYPDAFVRAVDGFSIGSSRNGTEQARGQFDDLETFNYPLSASEISARPDSDGDGLPDGWEIQFGLDPYSASGNNGADGDPDGDGLTNLEEWALETNPTVNDLPGGGTGAIKIHTPLE